MDDLKRYTAGVALTVLLLGCGDSMAPGNSGGGGNPNPPPPAPLLLKDVVYSRLPSPYYHFDYDSENRVRAVSFASGITSYEVIYQGERISELRVKALSPQDRLEYGYDAAGRVDTVRYVHPDGTVFTRVTFSYDGARLTGLERKRLITGSFVVEKSVTFSYDADGNLQELTEHRPLIEGFQTATTTVDRYEQYDTGINVDGFGLIHDDFFDHLVLLPGVVLQKGNPGRVTRTGDGTTFTVDYTYSYDDRNRPLNASGDLLLTNGPDAGQHFPIQSVFSYY